MKYRLLKDYKLKEIVPGTHLVLLKGATVELSGEGGFGDGAETFEEIKEPESQEGIDCPGCADTYTELPDGLCVKCRPQEKELAKAEYRAERSRDQAVLDEAIKASKPQEKEECKYERRCGGCNRVFYITDDVAVNCPDYPKCLPKQDCLHKNVVTWCGDCEDVVSSKEKEQQKPSTKIINLRWQNYPDSVGEYKALEATVCAIMDFLDSVAEGKYKL